MTPATGLWRDRYQALSLVAEGGQGRLLRGVDRLHGRPVALKVRPAGPKIDREGLLSEARVLLDLRPHPGLPLVRDDFFVDDRYVVVMDWVEGTTLAQVLAERGNPGLPVEVVLPWVKQVAEALDHPHGHLPPVAHGDVTPANIVLTSAGRPVLVDFGAAGVAPAGAARGTPGFTAPEVAAGRGPTPPGDVYGLAATAYCLLSGGPVDGAPPPWDDLEPGAEVVIERALRAGLATEASRRPASAGELASRAQAWAGASPSRRPPSPSRRPPSPSPRSASPSRQRQARPGRQLRPGRQPPRRRHWPFIRAGLAAGAVLVGLVALGRWLWEASPGPAQVSSVQRLQGPDRYATAAAIALGSFGRSPVAVLARGDIFADALAANYLAGVEGAPVLLTPPAPAPLAPSTLHALLALRTRQVFVVGDATAVSPSVDTVLRHHGMRVTRLAAPTRDETAAVVAQAGGPPASLGSLGPTAVLANDSDPADALAGGALAYWGRFPLLFTPAGSLSAATTGALREAGITHVVILGDTAAVSAGVAAQVRVLGMSVQRLPGPDGPATAVAIADLETNQLGWSVAHVDLARGDSFPDAAAGGPSAGRQRAALLLTVGRHGLSPVTEAYLHAHVGQVKAMTVFGDATSVSRSAVQQAVRAAGIS